MLTYKVSIKHSQMSHKNRLIHWLNHYSLCFPTGDHKSEQTDSPHLNNGPVTAGQNPVDSKSSNDNAAEHGEQDADDEGAEDTDDTRFVYQHLVALMVILRAGLNLWTGENRKVQTSYCCLSSVKITRNHFSHYCGI